MNRQNFWKCWGKAACSLGLCLVVSGPLSFANETSKAGERKTGLYQDVFDQVAYDEFVNQLDVGRWGRRIFGKRIPSANVNIFDEVPDSAFFVNRHGRQKLSPADLERGYQEKAGPDLSRPLTVLEAEEQNSHYRFLVEDAQKDRYVLKFDSQGFAELNTAAEMIANRFYFALGYNVPQITLVSFSAEQITAGPEAAAYDHTGFKKNLTQELLQQYLLFLPLLNGQYRASAYKIPEGVRGGHFSFTGREKDNPHDLINHRDRREIRALGVFAAWLNHSELLESGTLNVIKAENGQKTSQYFLGDFTNALGAAADGAKPPIAGYEHLVDYGDIFKSVISLGFWEKPWQKKWRQAGEKTVSPAIGYFSNEFFNPAKFKNLLPYEAFRCVTPADGFWAAKIMMSFSNEDIRAIVKAGQYGRSEDEDYLTKTLIERRDLIARHWFSVSSPLDQFDLSKDRLSFKDLAVEHGFVPGGKTTYHAEIFAGNNKISVLESKEPAIKIPENILDEKTVVRLLLKTIRETRPSKDSSAVTVLMDAQGIRGIRHEN